MKFHISNLFRVSFSFLRSSPPLSKQCCACKPATIFVFVSNFLEKKNSQNMKIPLNFYKLIIASNIINSCLNSYFFSLNSRMDLFQNWRNYWYVVSVGVMVKQNSIVMIEILPAKCNEFKLNFLFLSLKN